MKTLMWLAIVIIGIITIFFSIEIIFNVFCGELVC